MTKKTRIYFVHDAKEQGTPTRTLALRGTEDGSVEVGMALCHYNDQFCRRTGRVKAQGRLEGQAQSLYGIVRSYEELESLLGDYDMGSTQELEFCFSLVVRDVTDGVFVEEMDKVCS